MGYSSNGNIVEHELGLPASRAALAEMTIRAAIRASPFSILDDFLCTCSCMELECYLVMVVEDYMA